MRKAIKKQLFYIRRNLKFIDGLMKHYDELAPKQKNKLETIRILYSQQKEMIDEHKHSMEDRIVNISQLHIRLIIRRKANAKVEFGAKVGISVIRNAVEGKFGIGKIAYGLDRVMAKLKNTSETTINLAFLAMNLIKALCAFCCEN